MQSRHLAAVLLFFWDMNKYEIIIISTTLNSRKSSFSSLLWKFEYFKYRFAGQEGNVFPENQRQPNYFMIM